MKRRLLTGVASAIALAASLMIGTVGQAAAADPPAAAAAAAGAANGQRNGVTPNAKLPATIRVDDTTHKIVETLRGVGKQVYECTNGQYVLREPVAGLLTLRGAPAGIHGKGPFWALFDGSKVTGSGPIAVPSPSGASNVAWLLVNAAPEGTGGALSSVKFIQRIDTKGGVAPATCGPQTLSVDYSANYVFWAPK